MTITYPITLPNDPLPRSSRIKMMNASGGTKSPSTFERQTFFWGGAAFSITVEYPPMRRDNASNLIAAMGKLKGPYGSFLIGDSDARAPRGVGTGTPLVNGGSQVGDVLVTDGWTHGVTGILLRGDYIQIGSGNTARLHMVLDDANSDGSGNASLTVWPPVGPPSRSSYGDNAALTLFNTAGQFALDTDFEWSADAVSTYGVTFTATEAL